MRLLTLLFSLYLTCLACLPCADEAVTCAEPTLPTVAAAHSDGGRAGSGDWCSPLCQCHCCAGAVAPAAPATLAVAAPPLARRRPLLVAAVPTQPARGVWQPPRAYFFPLFSC